MGWNGLERNKLDYILTDLLPVELSELFSFKEFYDFLNKKENYKIINDILKDVKKTKAQNKKIFESDWATQPLKYSILKGSNSFRKMSVVQPISAINIYIFIELYQKDILNFFEKEHCFSLRYHKKSSELYYKRTSKKVITYFEKQSKKLGKLAIQQMGSFFKTIPFESINSFTGSLVWRMSNFRYAYYAKIDYKSCFDSIYTHSYKWIIEKNIIDSKNANGSSLLITIDRILQNANGKSTNGLIVGPEFSRMIAEVLLQHIDKKVNLMLKQEEIIQGRDYVAYRYVDDIFIFGKSKEIVENVISKFSYVSEKYLLKLNELKIAKGETPCLPKIWLEKTRNVSDILNNCFYTNQEYKIHNYIVKKEYTFVDRIKDEIDVLIKTEENEKRTIVSYLLSTIFNNISRKKDGLILFESNSHGRPMMILDIAFYIYAFSPTYEQTRKMMSIIVYVNEELKFKNDDAAKKKLKNLVDRYDFIYKNGNIFDLVDWFVFLLEYNITLNVNVEEAIVEKASQVNDPIIWANILLYSKYNKKFHSEIKERVESVIEKQIKKINKNVLLYQEFWYILIFHNCPYINLSLMEKINKIIDEIKVTQEQNPIHKAKNLLYNFLKITNQINEKPKNSFFNWSGEKDIGAKITYRTYQRTIFKKYNKKNGFYASID